ncbi:MAG: hypothetical protein ACK5QX_11405 [bacterium]|jgi:hypothetical protein
MSDPIRTALDKAACAICLCEGECFETRHGMMHGPCEKQLGKAANTVAAFLYAVNSSKWPRAIWLADAVLAAAKDQTNA